MLYIYMELLVKPEILALYIPYFSTDNARVIYTKRSKFIKNEHARYTLKGYEVNQI
jgi:hypothetical protein